MKFATVLIGTVTLCCPPVSAQADTVKSRPQVSAELAAVPLTPRTPGIPKTRAQVVAELVEARRTGDMPNEFGLKLNEIDPRFYVDVERQARNTALK